MDFKGWQCGDEYENERGVSVVFFHDQFPLVLVLAAPLNVESVTANDHRFEGYCEQPGGLPLTDDTASAELFSADNLPAVNVLCGFGMLEYLICPQLGEVNFLW